MKTAKKTAKVSKAIKLCGTEQPDVVGRILRAGPLSAEFDSGNLRYLRVGGVEVLRSLAFLVRDENWGTYIPTLSNMKVRQRKDGFSVSYSASCTRDGMQITYEASIEGRPDGSLEFVGVATPTTDFLTARTGFVVLHPLKGVAAHPVQIEHVDGKIEKSKFPAQVNPIQPFLLIRSMTHEVMPGLKATVRMEGDAWETEDHRNWTDASFKTYVRPLALPWPYTLPAGEPVRQRVTLTLSGAAPGAQAVDAAGSLRVRLGTTSSRRMPPLGLGMPAAEVKHALRNLELLKLAAPKTLVCHYDPRQNPGLQALEGFRELCAQTGADCMLEVVVDSVDAYAAELQALAGLLDKSGLKPASIAVVPVGDLKSVLPGGERPPAPPLDTLYQAARAAFPGIAIGGGMFSFFTELNRKRPPAHLLDFVTNTTCPIVHAADDRSVMETHEALPYQIATARSYLGKTPHRVGPSAIGCRDNPHGQTFTPNPDNERICLVRMDPRQRGLFGAAWTLGYLATLAPTGVQALSIGAATGPLGVIYRKDEHAQPWFDSLGEPAVYPAFHVIAGLTRAAGARLVNVECSDTGALRALAYRAKGATLLWIANATAQPQTVQIEHAGGALVGCALDEASFEQACRDPRAFQGSQRTLDGDRLSLGAYGVAIICVNDA